MFPGCFFIWIRFLHQFKEFCGHGVGLAIHENPYIFHFEPNEPTVTLVPGMVFTIEPMLNLGKADIFVDADDEWTVFTEY